MTEEARIRAGDAERQHAVDRLTKHFTDGRLDASEYDERIGRAYQVKYLDELPGLFSDLPPEPAPISWFTPGVNQAPPAPLPYPRPYRPPFPPPAGTTHLGRARRVFAVIAVILLLLALTRGLVLLPLGVFLIVMLTLNHRRGTGWYRSQHGGHDGRDDSWKGHRHGPWR